MVRGIEVILVGLDQKLVEVAGSLGSHTVLEEIN